MHVVVRRFYLAGWPAGYRCAVRLRVRGPATSGWGGEPAQAIQHKGIMRAAKAHDIQPAGIRVNEQPFNFTQNSGIRDILPPKSQFCTACQPRCCVGNKCTFWRVKRMQAGKIGPPYRGACGQKSNNFGLGDARSPTNGGHTPYKRHVWPRRA